MSRLNSEVAPEPLKPSGRPGDEALDLLTELQSELLYGRLTEEKRGECLELLARAKAEVRDLVTGRRK